MPTTTAVSPVAIKIDAATKARLKRLATARNRTPHWLMREEKREAFRQDGIKAWNDYRATGLHVTAREADAWLAKLQAGQDAEPPECHA